MPIFEFHCEQCGHKFEELLRSSDEVVSCPTCRSPKVEKLLSVFASSIPSSSGAPPCARPGCGSGFS